MLCSFNNVILKTSRSEATLAAIGSGATVRFYLGAAPADASVAVTGTFLGSLPCSYPFGVVTPGISGGAPATLTASPIASGMGVFTGTPGFGRVTTSGSIGVIDLDCSAVGGSGAIIMTPDLITLNAPIGISSIVIPEG